MYSVVNDSLYVNEPVVSVVGVYVAGLRKVCGEGIGKG